MHDKQAMISLCVFVFLIHLHKLRYNTFIWSVLLVRLGSVRFLIIRHQHGSYLTLAVLILYFTSIVLILFMCRCISVLICNLLTRLVAGSNRKSSNHMKDHPFIPYSYRYNQTKIKTSQIYTKVKNVCVCAIALLTGPIQMPQRHAANAKSNGKHNAKHNVLIIIIDNKLNCQHFSAKYRFR